MPWSTSYRSDPAFVLIVYSGVIPPEALVEAATTTLALGRQHGTKRFLADCTALEGGHSIVDLYNLAKLLESVGIPVGTREAIVLPQLAAAADDVQFWETTCRNRGFIVRVFADVAPAMAWLVAGEPQALVE
jgi:hypothetical protein